MSLKDDLNEKKNQLSKGLGDAKDNLAEEYNEAKEKLGEEIDDAKEALDEKFDKATDAISSGVKTGVKKTKSFFKWLFALLFVGAILAGIGYFLYSNWTFSEGTRAGKLMKVSKKGYVFKTFEGQLGMEGMQTGADGLSSVWNFSLTDESLYRELESLQGNDVTLRYKEINKAMPWQGDTNYFILDVEKR